MKSTVVAMFIVDHEDLGGFYGTPCNREFIRATRELIPNQGLAPRLLYGDFLLHHLGYVPQSVAQGQVTVGTSPDRLEALTWEFVLALAPTWNGRSLLNLPLTMSKHRLYLTSICQIEVDDVSPIWDQLSSFGPAVGVFLVDEGHLLIRHLIYEYLYKDIGITDNSLLVAIGDGEDEDSSGIWSSLADDLDLELECVPQTDFEKRVQSIPSQTILSKLGRRYENVRIATLSPDHAHRVLQELQSLCANGQDVSLSLSSEGVEHNLIIDPRKLRDYALNPEHAKGKGKARVFESVLGIRRADHMYLAQEILKGMPNSGLSKVRATDYGIQYQSDVVVTGLNGNQCLVRTAWETNNGLPTRLTTAYVDSSAFSEEAIESPGLIPRVEPQEDWWAKITTLARSVANEAANNVIPTPMGLYGDSVEGDETDNQMLPPEMEGACGYAWVLIHDGRTAFAKWFVKTGIGRTGSHDGVRLTIFHATQSLKRARAYADAYADVLKRHGIECTVDSRFD